VKTMVSISLVAASCLAGAEAFQYGAFGSASLRTPRHSALSTHSATRRVRQASSILAMADGEDAGAKAKAAAQRAEKGLVGSGSLFDESPKTGALDDSKLQALFKKEPDVSEESAEAVKVEAGKAKERMDTFEAQLKDVRDRKSTGKSKEELNLRGVRIGAATGEETEWLEEPEGEEVKMNTLQQMDAKLKDVLSVFNEDTSTNKIRDDRLRTETGEELLYAEFAPGASISSLSLPENFDPLNPPLPSEMKKMQMQGANGEMTGEEEEEEEEEDALSIRLARGEMTEGGFMPMPSQASSPTNKAKLYDRNAKGVQDDSLFSIKSVFDSTGIAVPGKTVSRAEREARAKGFIPMNKDDVDPLEDLVARDRAALRASKAAEAAELQAAKPESFGQTVTKVMGIVVVADFFVILGFLGWLVVSIIYQYAVCGGLTPETASGELAPICANPVYDALYSLWTPVIQPALGILMASVILERTIKSVAGAKED